MSLEDSMAKFAAALEKNADALNAHTEVLKSCLASGVAFVTSNAGVPAGAAAAAPAKSEEAPGKGRGKKKEEPKVDSKADDFDDEPSATAAADDFDDEPKKSYTADEIRALLMKVKDAKGADAARHILKELGVTTIANIPEKDFGKAASLAAKAGVTP